MSRHWFEAMPNGMIEPRHPVLSIRAQCRLLSISRSSFYDEAQGESAPNLALMLLVDKPFPDTPFYGVRQRTWPLRNQGHAVNEKRTRRLIRPMGVRRENSVPHGFPTLLTADPAEAQHRQAREGPQDLPLSATRAAGEQAGSGQVAPTSPGSRCGGDFSI